MKKSQSYRQRAGDPMAFRVARAAIDMSVQDLADRLGIHGSHVRKIESGEVMPSLALGLAICQELKQDPDDLFPVT